jgi:hypothetical protein
VTNLFIPTVVIGSVYVPVESANEITEEWHEVKGRTDLRTLGGVGVRQTHWVRLGCSLTGQGWYPEGLAALDYGSQLTIAGSVKRSVQGASNVITLPTARRTDTGYEPTGYAVVYGRRTPTTISVLSGVATLGVVSGASSYGVDYYPQITAYADFRTTGRPNDLNFGWTITAEQV